MTRKERIFQCCHHCKDRDEFGACHDVCVTYLSALEEWRKLQETINKAKHERYIFEKYHHDRIMHQHKVNQNKNGR